MTGIDLFILNGLLQFWDFMKSWTNHLNWFNQLDPVEVLAFYSEQ